ncbi:hypothetical protein ACGFX4_34295 [Kitasatospora sp. NPDC048365]|uniref:hypothetical protein n=1 Tax=Kitasatospora sp. NPDC048365 TaxID=3364050 RepID=UPI00371C29E8
MTSIKRALATVAVLTAVLPIAGAAHATGPQGPGGSAPSGADAVHHAHPFGGLDTFLAGLNRGFAPMGR